MSSAEEERRIEERYGRQSPDLVRHLDSGAVARFKSLDVRRQRSELEAFLRDAQVRQETSIISVLRCRHATLIRSVVQETATWTYEGIQKEFDNSLEQRAGGVERLEDGSLPHPW
jgi:hypothetical protein